MPAMPGDVQSFQGGAGWEVLEVGGFIAACGVASSFACAVAAIAARFTARGSAGD